MVDTEDSKSSALTGVRVQVPSWVPYKQLNQIFSKDKKNIEYKQNYFYFEIIVKRDKKQKRSK